jgi:dihydroorotase
MYTSAMASDSPNFVFGLTQGEDVVTSVIHRTSANTQITGEMMEAVVPTIRQGGVNVAYVMPNLVPPLTSGSAVLAYKQRLLAEEPNVTYLMTLYLHESIGPAIIKGAKAQGIVGVKSYPAGVTTNSDTGVISYEPFYPVFSAMEQCGMVLNLHGECPSDHAKDITILNAESSFLPTLKSLHAKFPKVTQFPRIFPNRLY